MFRILVITLVCAPFSAQTIQSLNTPEHNTPTGLPSAVVWKWNNTEVISTESINNALSPALAVDIAGNVHIAWADFTDYSGSGADADILYTFWNSTTETWNTTEVVSKESTDHSRRPTLAVDTAGNIHIGWMDYTDYTGAGTDADIFYTFWNSTIETWNNTEVISTDSTWESYSPSLAVDTAGNAHIAWEEFTGTDIDILYTFWNSTTETWNTTEVVSKESTEGSYSASLAVDTAGNVHITWSDNTDYTGAGTDADIFYTFWNSTAETWNTTEVISTESTEGSHNPALAVDGAGNVHITWFDYTAFAGIDTDIVYKCWNSSIESWRTTEVVSTDSTDGSYYPSLAVDTAGNVHIAWHDYTNYDGAGMDIDIFYTFWSSSVESWTPTQVVSTNSTADSVYPSLGVDAMGKAHLAWYDETDYAGAGEDKDIFYSNFTVPNIPPLDAPILEILDSNPSTTGDVTLNWTEVDNADRYHIYRQESSISSIEGLAPLATTTLTMYDDMAGLPNGTYYYVVAASNDYQNVSSNEEWIEVARPEEDPTLDSPVLEPILPNPSTTGNITLNWNMVENASDYHIYREESPISSINGLTPIAEVATNAYVDQGLENGTYYYVVVASNGYETAMSNEEWVEVAISAEDDPSLSDPVLNTIFPNPSTTGNITLNWDIVKNAEKYHIYREETSIESVEGLNPIAMVTTNTYIDVGLTNGTYYYVIVAINDYESVVSNEEWVTVAIPETINPTDPTDPTNTTKINFSIYGLGAGILVGVGSRYRKKGK